MATDSGRIGFMLKAPNEGDYPFTPYVYLVKSVFP